MEQMTSRIKQTFLELHLQISSEIPTVPTSVQLICESSSQNSGKHLLVYQLIERSAKAPDGHLDEEIHRARSGKVPSVGASVPRRWGAWPSQCTCVEQLGTSLNAILLGFCGGFFM